MLLTLAVDKHGARVTQDNREVLLHEYDKLKDESTERIKQRDNFVYLNVVSIAALTGLGASSPQREWSILGVPWIATAFGWLYLMNDEKISALSRYTQFYLAPRLGGLRWESTTKRRTNLAAVHRAGQLIVDLSIFVFPTPIALTIFDRNGSEWTTPLIAVAVIEGALSAGLGLAILLHSPLIKTRLDVDESHWRSGGEAPPSSKPIATIKSDSHD